MIERLTLDTGEMMQLTPVNLEKFIEAGRGTRLGPQWPGQRCLAKTRQGTACENPAMNNRERCRMHGGKSFGPRTAEGKARVIAANTTHGRRSRAHAARVKEINAELRRVLNEMRMEGLIP